MDKNLEKQSVMALIIMSESIDDADEVICNELPELETYEQKIEWLSKEFGLTWFKHEEEDLEQTYYALLSAAMKCEIEGCE